MIQANELRIGNYIKSDDGVIFSLECIESKNFTDWNSGNDYSLIAKEIGTRDNYLNCINDSWQPIAITEEILLKCGFDKLPYSYSLNRIRITLQDQSDIWWVAFNANSAHVAKIKHLHQLQNLYFALTGQELNIEL